MPIKLHLVCAVLLITGLSPDLGGEPLEPPTTRKEKSPLIGTWASALCMSGTGPTDISVVTIKEDGTYHWVRIGTIPEENWHDKPGVYRPVGAELKSLENGRINLKSGCQIITAQDRNLHVESVTWTVKGDELNWSMMIEGMGGQGLSFRRISS